MRHKDKHTVNFLMIAISIISVIGLTCLMDADPKLIRDPLLSDRTTVFQFFICSIRCMSKQRYLCCFLAVCIVYLLCKMSSLQFAIYEKLLSFFLSVLFAFSQLLGHSYMNCNNWNEVFGNDFRLLRSIAAFVGYVVVTSCLILLFFRLIDDSSTDIKRDEKTEVFRHLRAITLIKIISWLPYYIYFFPGTSSPDTSEQIAWAFHYSTQGLNLTAVRGNDYFISNSHPYFTTLIFGFFSKLGILFGKIEYGIAIYCFLQMSLTALAFAFVWLYLSSIGVNRKIIVSGVTFTTIFPLFPMYAICMVKDSLFSLACLALTVLLIEIVRTEGEALNSIRFCIFLSLCSSMVMLTKNQGVYLIILSAISSAMFYRKIKIVLSMILPVLFFQIVWLHMLLPAWNVSPGGKQEVLGLLFQQTARYMTMYPEDITKDDEASIRGVLDYDHLVELYNPTLADPVKYTFNQDCSTIQLQKYFKTWREMFSRHPDSYVQAFFNNMYGSYYLESNSVLVYLDFDNRDLEAHPELCVHHSKRVEAIKELKYTLPQLIQSIPAIGLLFSVGFYPWIILFATLDSIRKMKFAFLVPLSPMLISLAILMVSPVSGSFRYNMPILYTSPFLLSLCFLI